MKNKIFSILSVLLFALPLSAQVQQGYVKTLGRPGAPGKPLQGVTIRVRGVMNALVSDANGSFKIQATGKKDGDALIINSIHKNGYELKDKEIVGRSLVFSSRVPIQLVMVSSSQLATDKKRIEDNAYKVAENNYKKKVAELEKQKKQKELSAKDYEAQLQELETRYENYMALVGDMAERYALTDYDELDSIDIQINECIENGELDKADSLIHSVFDPTTVLQRNQEAKAEIAERMRIAQEAIDKALADKQQLEQNLEYATRLAQNCESLAADYLQQGMTEKARENYTHALELIRLISGEDNDDAKRLESIISSIPK